MALNATPGAQARMTNPSLPASLNPAVVGSGRGTAAAPWPKLLLDSGASIHVVGDPKLLSNLRNAPAEMRVRVANGDTLPITKIGDIQMISDGFTIPEVHLAAGLKSDLIRVRQLTRQGRIWAWFDGNRATLYAGPELVAVAVAPPPQQKNGLYVLQSLNVPPKTAAGNNNGCLDDGEMTLVWRASSSARAPRRWPVTKHVTWISQFWRILVDIAPKQKWLIIALCGVMFWSVYRLFFILREVYHLFLVCRPCFGTKSWAGISIPLQIDRSVVPSQDLQSLKDQLEALFFVEIIIVMCCGIWMVRRNDWIFRPISPSLQASN